MYMTGKRPFVNAEESLKIPVSLRVVDNLPLYHDSQFSAFSTEALIRNNQGTIAVVLLWPALADNNGT